MRLDDLIAGKRVAFLTTKDLDYIRNVQEVRLLQASARSCRVFGYTDKNYLPRMIKLYCAVLFTSFQKLDVIFVGFAPQLVLPLLWLKKGRRTLVVDFFISFYDTLAFDRKKIKPDGLFGRFSKWVDRQTLRVADHVIGDTKAHCRYFSEEFGKDASSFEVLYLAADAAVYHPMEATRPEAWRKKKLVLYFGSVLPLQGVDIVLAAGELLCDEDPDAVMAVIGPVKGYVPKNERLVLIPWLCQTELARHIAMADLTLAGHFCDSIEKAKRTIPGKAYIYRAMEKPMVLGENDANRELFADTPKQVYYTNMGDPQALADCIRRALSELGCCASASDGGVNG